jgi:DNA processing protein
MTLPAISPNTQAILLLTAPLIAGKGAPSSGLLSHSEYRRIARRLHEMQLQPSNLLDSNPADLLPICQGIVEESRLRGLLERGFLLSQVVEHWQSRAIWVVSRADEHYPRRLKKRLREDAPALIYGCGEVELLETGGLAVVGSRHVDEALIESTMVIGRLAALAGKTLVSGGAKGIDQAAMRGALEAGGNAIGVLADSLEKTALKREHRNLLMDRQLILISPYDPNAGFNVGHAMQRNKLIYALADVSLVMSSDFNKGGTWAGATEQLEQLRLVPVYVRLAGEDSTGLEALRRKGALPWPNPQNADSFKSVFEAPILTKVAQVDLPLSGIGDVAPSRVSTESLSSEGEFVQQSPQTTGISAEAFDQNHQGNEVFKEMHRLKTKSGAGEVVMSTDLAAGEVLFATVRELIRLLLSRPMKETELASTLKVSTSQTKVWLQRLIDEDVVIRQKRPAGYIVKQPPLFEKQT